MLLSVLHHTKPTQEALWRKPDSSKSYQLDGVGRMVGADCGTEKVGSSRSHPLQGIGVALW